jgi:hypothetical protein
MSPNPVAQPPVENVNMDTTGRFAFVEFHSEEMATAAPGLDGKVGGGRSGGRRAEASS